MEIPTYDLIYVLGTKLVESPFNHSYANDKVIGNYKIKNGKNLYIGEGKLLYNIPFIDDRIVKGNRVTIYVVIDGDNENSKETEDSYIIIEDHDSLKIDSIHGGDVFFNDDDKKIWEDIKTFNEIETKENVKDLTDKRYLLISPELFLNLEEKRINDEINLLINKHSIKTKTTVIDLEKRNLNKEDIQDYLNNERRKLEKATDKLFEKGKETYEERIKLKEKSKDKLTEIDNAIQEIIKRNNTETSKRTSKFLASCSFVFKCSKTGKEETIPDFIVSERPNFPEFHNLEERKLNQDK